ncbi:MAG: hypothetical protein ACLFPE_11035 [Bacteroidales bacterium]
MKRLPDGGPMYFETDFDQWIVEPWNAFSSLTFLIPVIYLFIALRGQYKQYGFLLFWASPLMVIGGTGSTIYHAFRESRFFLFMDFVPIALLTLSISIYLWLKILTKWWYIFGIVALFIAMRFAAFHYLSGSATINASYFITGVMIFLPALILLIKSNFYKVWLLVCSILFFGLALLFRYADDWQTPLLPIGTHWLWHIFTSAGALVMAMYLVKIKPLKVK